MQLNQAQQNVLSSMYGMTGNPPAMTQGFQQNSVQLLQQPGGPARNPGEIRAGDVVSYTNATGTHTVTLNAQQAAEIMHRSNIVQLALNGAHWNPTPGFNATPGMTGQNGQPIATQVGNHNGVWQYSNIPGTSGVGIAPAQGVTPATAIEHMFNPQTQGNYQFDCATGVRVVNLMGELNTLRQMHGNEQGTALFNQRHQNLFLYSHYDSAEPAGPNQYDFDGGTWQNNNTNAPVQAGNLVYWRLGTGQDTSAGAGWNSIAVGPNASGQMQYYTFINPRHAHGAWALFTRPPQPAHIVSSMGIDVPQLTNGLPAPAQAPRAR